ncbi:hypothetical protein NXS19_002644 [Fusarium pseudograminearum]|nr:hypothetical protein NXS19_002644 [Fusarium pseudograminearum]
MMRASLTSLAPPSKYRDETKSVKKAATIWILQSHPINPILPHPTHQLNHHTRFKIIVTSDTICPWCYVGRRQLQAAQRLWEQKYPDSNDTFSVSYQPFQLKPEWPRGPGSSVSKEKVYNEKFGKERVAMMHKHLSSVGEGLGIKFKYGGQTGNTRDSHRLVQLAKKHGEEAEGKALDGLFAAYFEENEDITSYDILKKVAVEAGIPEAEFQKSIIDSDEFGPEVDRLSEEAQYSGVRGVPDFCLGEDQSG